MAEKKQCPEMFELAIKKARDGVPFYVIGPAIGVSETVFRRMRIQNKDFDAKLMKAKAEHSEDMLKVYNEIIQGKADEKIYPDTRRKAIEKALVVAWPKQIHDANVSISDVTHPAMEGWEMVKKQRGIKVSDSERD